VHKKKLYNMAAGAAVGLGLVGIGSKSMDALDDLKTLLFIVF
jgi:hypothetical protein